MKTAITLPYIVLMAVVLTACRSPAPNGHMLSSQMVLHPEDIRRDGVELSRDWLERQVSLREAWDIAGDGEALESVDEEAQALWLTFTSQLKPGDTLWYWRTPPASWRNLAGRGGLAIERDGRFVDVLLTQMN